MSIEAKILSLAAFGPDSPGLVSKLTTRIFELGGNILDVEENCRRGLFTIFLVIDFSGSRIPLAEAALRLEALGADTGLSITLAEFPRQPVSPPAAHENHVVTILGVDRPGIIAQVSTFFHRRNINIESCRMIARGRFFSMEMVVDTGRMTAEPPLTQAQAVEKMKGELKTQCAEIQQSVVIQSEDVFNRGKKLVVFDLESTLIQLSSLGEFLKNLQGKLPPSSAPLESNGGEPDQLRALIENARLLRGIPIRDLESFGETLQLNPGALELVKILKSMGFKIALITSGFNFFIKRMFRAAGIDYAFSNALRVDARGLTTGELEEPLITSATKGGILEFIMKMENVTREQVIAVGDGSVGSHYMRNVGLSIAFRPEHRSIETDGVLSGDQILNVLYCLGIPRSELERHLRDETVG